MTERLPAHSVAVLNWSHGSAPAASRPRHVAERRQRSANKRSIAACLWNDTGDTVARQRSVPIAILF